MTNSLRDLLRQDADRVEIPTLDAGDVIAQGEQRLHRRRITAALASIAAVAVIAVGGIVAGSGQQHQSEGPIDKPNKNKTNQTDEVQTRRLTYALGSMIHWGDASIDVAPQANWWPGTGKLVDWVDATDDGAVFVIGGPPSGGVIPVGPAGVWFTDGSAPVRIGTTSGDLPRGFAVAPTAEGSIMAWTDPGSRTRSGQIVVYDTSRMSEVARFGDADAEPLAVYPDVVYWSPTGTGCSAYPGGSWGKAGCQGTGPVMRYDTTSGQQSQVSRADYLADRQARPGVLTESDPDGAGSLFLPFIRRGDRLVADHGELPTVAQSGLPLRLRLPADERTPQGLMLTQWLDPDRVVLVGTNSHDGHDLVVCRLSTGRCQVAVHIPNATPSFTPPGPAISRG